MHPLKKMLETIITDKHIDKHTHIYTHVDNSPSKTIMWIYDHFKFKEVFTGECLPWHLTKNIFLDP